MSSYIFVVGLMEEIGKIICQTLELGNLRKRAFVIIVYHTARQWLLSLVLIIPTQYLFQMRYFCLLQVRAWPGEISLHLPVVKKVTSVWVLYGWCSLWTLSYIALWHGTSILSCQANMGLQNPGTSSSWYDRNLYLYFLNSRFLLSCNSEQRYETFKFTAIKNINFLSRMYVHKTNSLQEKCNLE